MRRLPLVTVIILLSDVSFAPVERPVGALKLMVVRSSPLGAAVRVSVCALSGDSPTGTMSTAMLLTESL